MKLSARLDALVSWLVWITLMLLLGALYTVFVRAPVESTMGVVQKIFYFHVPSAYCMYLGAGACLLGSLGDLYRPSSVWDAVARTGAELAVLFGAIVLSTGPLWAVKAWGYYWTWDPRLTTTLLSVLLYVAYGVLRSLGEEGGERRFAAVLGVLSAANLPVIHYSVQKWSGQHPAVITGRGGGLQHPDMRLALLLSFVGFTFLFALFLWIRARCALLQSRYAALQEALWEKGVDTENLSSVR